VKWSLSGRLIFYVTFICFRRVFNLNCYSKKKKKKDRTKEKREKRKEKREKRKEEKERKRKREKEKKRKKTKRRKRKRKKKKKKKENRKKVLFSNCGQLFECSFFLIDYFFILPAIFYSYCEGRIFFLYSGYC